jgi:hypothetical protein
MRIEVTCDGQGRPVAFRWRQRSYAVAEIVDCWAVRTLWWQNEVQRSYYRVMTPTFGVYGMYKQEDSWYLDTVLA